MRIAALAADDELDRELLLIDPPPLSQRETMEVCGHGSAVGRYDAARSREALS